MTNRQFTYVILTILIVFFITIESLFYYMARHNKYISNIIDIRNGVAQCIIMGDSHTQDAFRHELDNCLNISIGGSSIPLIIDAVQSIIHKNKISHIILPLEPHNFTSYRLVNQNDTFKNISDIFDPMYIPLFSIPILQEYFQKTIYSKFKIDNDKEKELWSNLNKNQQLQRINTRLDKHIPVQNYENTQYAEEYLKFIKSLIKQNIKVCLVRTPVTIEYNNTMFENISKNEWDAFVNKFENAGATYIDYEDLNFNNTNDKIFTDQDHLNELGARYYSKQIYNNCFN